MPISSATFHLGATVEETHHENQSFRSDSFDSPSRMEIPSTGDVVGPFVLI